MTAVITMAVEREMNADKVMKHALSIVNSLRNVNSSEKG